MRRAPLRWRASILVVVMASLVGCASFSSIVVTEPTPTPREEQREERALALRIAEARPNGFLIEVRADTSRLPPDRRFTKLQLARSRDGEPALILQEVLLDEATATKLGEQGVVILDQNVEAKHEYSYQAVLIDAQDEAITSGVASMAWREPLAAPDEPSATSIAEGVVELTWTPQPGWGVVVFRRDVLARKARLVRVGEVRDEVDVFIDRGVEPGRVYAYRIAYMTSRDGVDVYGAPSGEFYVKAPGDLSARE